jgi:hypothetical protein
MEFGFYKRAPMEIIEKVEEEVKERQSKHK